ARYREQPLTCGIAPWRVGSPFLLVLPFRVESRETVATPGIQVRPGRRYPMDMPKTNKKECPRDGCHSTDVNKGAPGVQVGFGSGLLPGALEDIWECRTCEQPFLLHERH